ncbi:MAG: hypothetical protein EA355_08325 [Rhodobacteraceae bacterium]|nr:MAG: hypothetical protein EA355_08325 [Paracoccaceae bacterium]
MIRTALALSFAVAVAACGATPTERGLSGGAIGAGVGATAGAVTGGSVATGAVVGGAVGAAAGALTSRRDLDLGPIRSPLD